MSEPTTTPAWTTTCTLRDWESMRSKLLFIFDNPMTTGTADGTFDRHGEYSAWLVRQGQAHVNCDGQECTVRAGQWLICTGKRITQKLEPGLHLMSLRMSAAWPNGDDLFTGPPLLLIQAKDHPHLEPLATQLLADVGYVESRPEHPSHTFLWRHRLDYLTFCRYQRHQIEWFEAIGQVMREGGIGIDIPRGIDPRLASALFVIDNLTFGEPFPTDRLNHHAGLSLGQLNRMCVRSYDLTLHAYWEQRRLERARQLLATPAASVKEIAYQLGFTQLSHFSTWFKRNVGESPRTYLKKHLNDGRA